jgi:RNA polymerase sigma factor (sigma-70 family)
MSPPAFSTLKDARAWLREHAVAEAASPFKPWLLPAELEDLLDHLDTAFATHPVVRTLATRAAKELVPPAAPALREAAKKPDHDDAIPLEPHAATTRLEPGLVGKPDLGREDYRAATLTVIKAVARHVAKSWKRDDLDDLIGEGWLVAVEIAPRWDGTQASYTTYLWGCVRARLIDYAKRAQHRREHPCGVWGEYLRAPDLAANDGVGKLREGLDAMATSYVMGLAREPETPEGTLLRAKLRDEIRVACAGLPARQREILRLVYEEDVPLKAAAGAVGVSYPTALRDHHEAQRSLHAVLSRKGKPRAVPGLPRKRPALRLVKNPPDEG